ncbi:MAG: hypothetical protein HYX45_06605 [Burkholderiales bacterium]|nr:hypothetical protein [Burkholderiales bacterium]
MTTEYMITEFDQRYGETLRRNWFVGDIHSEFKDLARRLMEVELQPRWGQ